MCQVQRAVTDGGAAHGKAAGFEYKKNLKQAQPAPYIHPNVMQSLDNTGIGLALVKQIVERHHGKVRIESKDGNTALYFTTNLDADGNPARL